MSEPTPGPWDIQNKGNLYVRSARVEVVKGRHTIARLKGLSEEDYANARLMAAAPDLLKQLEKALVDIEDFVNEDGEYDFTPEAGRQMAREISAAIEKAREL